MGVLRNQNNSQSDSDRIDLNNGHIWFKIELLIIKNISHYEEINRSSLYRYDLRNGCSFLHSPHLPRLPRFCCQSCHRIIIISDCSKTRKRVCTNWYRPFPFYFNPNQSFGFC
jgi:hypothetical protein